MDLLGSNYTLSEIKHKSIKGIKWVSAAEVVIRIIQFISIIILAKLLGPATFGTFGICLIFYRFLYAIGDLGFGTALIQKNNIEQKHLDTIFCLCLIFSTILCLILYSLADYLQQFFGSSNLAHPLRILSFIFILVACSTIFRSLFIKKLQFVQLTIIEVLSVLFNAVVALVLAYKGFGIWSLIIGLYSEHMLLTILLLIYGKWIPHFRIRYFFNTNIDKFLVGKFLGEHYLGIYLIAFSLIDMPVQRISKNATKVTFSTLSKFQDNLIEFKKTYKAINYYLSLIIFPLFAGLFIVAPEFIRVFYGPLWEEMIIPLRILCFAGIFRSLIVVSSTTLFALNKPQLEARIALVQGLILCILITLFLKLGIIAVSAAVTSGYLIGFSLSLFCSLSIVHLNFREYFKLISNPFTGAGIIIGIWCINLFTLRQYMSDVLFLTVNIAVGGIFFIIYVTLSDRTILFKLREILLSSHE
jgi:PST family polysaccharide transporter